MFLKQSILSDAEQNTEGLKIVYDDLAPYAKENSTASITRPGLRPRLGLHPGPGLHPRRTITEQEFPELKRDDISSVSYTHLDVYKRQLLTLLERQARQFKEPEKFMLHMDHQGVFCIRVKLWSALLLVVPGLQRGLKRY